MPDSKKSSKKGVTKGIHASGGRGQRGNSKPETATADSKGSLEGQAPVNYTPENIAGKAAIVAGGTTGIGKAIALLLAERGARVLVFGRNREDLDQTVKEITAAGGEGYGVAADQSIAADIRRVFRTADSKLGRLDILVNNAAVFAGSVASVSHEDIAYAVNVNIVGYMLCAHEAIARMQERRSGHIVNIGSMSAEAREEESDIYVATKAAIQAFSVSLRKSINPLGIKVSLIEPGLVESDLTSAGTNPRRQIQKQKMLEARDIAEGVHFCLTQPARCDVVTVQIRPHLQPI
jgi:NADP-dependent 3-hydroxy acid dehydrogenase YdfG